MKTPILENRRGIALVIVLSLLVLITVMVVGFLVRVGGERTASANYYAAATTRQLADTAVNLVQAQINEATTVGAGTSAWASQPGAVRVFDVNGQLSKIYRLYSAPTLVSSVSDASVLKDDVPKTGWADNSALWVDLNAPVTVASGSAGASGTDAYSVFPILDPRDPTNPGSVSAPGVTGTLAGFSLSGAVPGSSAAQPVPMPVQWLYVLQNGKIVTPSASGSNTVTVPEASAQNPIVGRIAFWTDDECAKVNVNTAAGSFSSRGGTVLPAPWETPHFKIWDERLLFSENQPVKGEFQRYPGHPATTDLYGILNALGMPTTGYPAVISNYSVSPQPTPSASPSGLSKITPYYADDNTSQGGSARTTASGTLPAINGGTAKQDRLYTSVGEMLFDPQRNRMLTGTNGADPRQQMESGKFFLTAHSRSPEVTLFGTPRISMWPIHVTTGTNYRTAYDRLAAFCATTGTGGNAYPYYIQRSSARSATYDYDNISRNQDLYRYLLRLTSREIPGFGGNFDAKYSVTHERDQILTEIIDYIRCTNLYDHSVPATNSSFVRYTSNPSGLSGGKAQVVPLKIVENGVTTHGLGRMQTLSEVGIHLICTADGNGPAYQAPVSAGMAAKVSPVNGSADSAAYASNLPEAQFLRKADGTIVDINGVTVTGTTPATVAFPSNPTLTSTGDYGGPLVPLVAGQKRVQAMLLFELASPMMGFDPMDTAIQPSYQINVTGINGISVAGQNPFPNRIATGTTGSNQNGNGLMPTMSTRTGSIQGTGGILGFRYLMLHYSGGKNVRFNGWSGISPNGGSTPYRYVSNPFTVSATGTSSVMTLKGGFTTEILVPLTTGSTTKVQTYAVDFPELTNLPVPDLPQNGVAGTYNAVAYSSLPADWWGFDKRIAWSSGPQVDSTGKKSPFLGLGCVIRSDIAVSGTWSYANSANIPLVGVTAQPALSDVVRTLVVKDGDYRLCSPQENIDAMGGGSSLFVKGPGYDSGGKVGNLFRDQGTSLGTVGVDTGGALVSGANYSWVLVPKVPTSMDPNKQKTWDWDTGLPAESDGAYANKPDEGNTYINGGSSPYYNRESQLGNDISSYFTANRIVSSPVMFGSLPTGVKENITWRTLLFRPQKSRPFDPSGPKDYLLLDLFSMPVVEPYAISEPFSSAGKINMNYQIVPFTYINRSTGLRAVLSSELIARVPKAAAAAKASWDQNTYYKGTPSSGTSTPPGAPSVTRLPVDMDMTLKQFETKFNAWGIYKSAAEICDVYLVPQGYSWADAASADAGWYGDDFALVGDNVRERPYANIYPRLTTKSNTYTVHFRVQALKNPTASKQDTWNADTGVVTGEYRGSTTIERYLDPSNPNIKDYATDASAPSLDTYYQWRTISNTTFAP